MASLSPNKASSGGSTPLIRWFGVFDLEAAFCLSRKLGGEDFWEREMFSIFLKRGNYGCFVACSKSSQALLGFLAFEQRPSDKRIHRLLMENGYEDIAPMLLRALQKFGSTKRQKSKPLSTVVRESELGVQLFFQGLEFRCEKTQENWFDCPPETGYLFVQRSMQG